MNIPLVTSLTEIPPDARCQEASRFSCKTYIPCSQPAVSIIDNGDSRPYYMCGPCANHNVKNRRAKVLLINSGEEQWVL